MKPNTAPQTVYPTFEPFRWTPRFPSDKPTVPALDLAKFIDHSRDVLAGATLVFDLSCAQSREAEVAERQPYLSRADVWILQRLAKRSLENLDAEAENLSVLLHDLERNQS